MHACVYNVHAYNRKIGLQPASVFQSLLEFISLGAPPHILFVDANGNIQFAGRLPLAKPPQAEPLRRLPKAGVKFGADFHNRCFRVRDRMEGLRVSDSDSICVIERRFAC